MRDALVVNASPLIFLGNAAQLDLLRVIGFRRVLVPSSVFDEVTTSGHADRAAHAVAEANWIERVSPPSTPNAVIEWDLGPGESAVIAACLGIRGAVPVVDDLAARKCALALGLQPIGTLGVVVAAHRRGYIRDLRQTLLDLRTSGMWLSDAVIERALSIAAP
jgi:predicted nucleic acid-binding protein